MLVYIREHEREQMLEKPVAIPAGLQTMFEGEIAMTKQIMRQKDLSDSHGLVFLVSPEILHTNIKNE